MKTKTQIIEIRHRITITFWDLCDIVVLTLLIGGIIKFYNLW